MPPSAMSNGKAASSAAVAPHSPVMTAVASEADEMLAREPAWPGHALAHAALSLLQLLSPAGSTSLKHLALPTGLNQPAGQSLLGEGVRVLLGVAEEVRELLGVPEGVPDSVAVLDSVPVVDAVSDAVAVRDAVRDALAELLAVIEDVLVTVELPDCVAEELAVCEGDAVVLGDEVGVGDVLGVGLHERPPASRRTAAVHT